MEITNHINRQQNLNTLKNKDRKFLNHPVVNNNFSDSVSFTGFGLKNLNPKNYKKVDRYVDYIIGHSSSMLGVSGDEIKRTLSFATPVQKKFFAYMADAYNSKNFYLPKEKRDNPMLVFDMFKNVKNPTAEHCDFVSNSNFNITQMHKVMESLKYKSNSIRKFHVIANDLTNIKDKSKEQVLTILDSKNKDDIINNYKTYRTYFKRHFNDKEMVANLDKQIENGTFDAVLENKKYSLEKYAGLFGFKEIIDVDKLAPYSTKESNTILDLLDNRLSPARLKDKSDYKKNLEEIYMSTNKDNFQARFNYLRTYSHTNGAHEYKKEEMSDINKLFKIMDENPKKAKFISDIAIPHSNIVGAGEYIKVLDSLDDKKLELYTDNIRYIFASKTDNPAEKAIRLCRKQPDTSFGKFMKGVKSYISKIGKKENIPARELKGYRRSILLSYKSVQVPKEQRPLTINDPTPNVPAVIYNHPVFAQKPYTPVIVPKLADITGAKNTFKFNISKPVVTEEKVVKDSVTPNLPAVIYNNSFIKTPVTQEVNKEITPVVRETVNKSVAPQENIEIIKKGIFVNKVAKQPSAKKLAIISDINNIIEKKLGKTTYADQVKGYENKATKMRAGMLPEIFASIKETRAQKRAAGTFNKHKSESNADALELFQKIKGNNKRLVNYMLKVRNADGTRMYTVRDIVGKINETEATIRTAKKSATKDAPFMAKDAKAIYDGILNDQIAQHGKLPRAKKA